MIRRPCPFVQAASAAEVLSVAFRGCASEIGRGKADGKRLNSARRSSSAQPSRKSYVRVFASGREPRSGIMINKLCKDVEPHLANPRVETRSSAATLTLPTLCQHRECRVHARQPVFCPSSSFPCMRACLVLCGRGLLSLPARNRICRCASWRVCVLTGVGGHEEIWIHFRMGTVRLIWKDIR